MHPILTNALSAFSHRLTDAGRGAPHLLGEIRVVRADPAHHGPQLSDQFNRHLVSNEHRQSPLCVVGGPPPSPSVGSGWGALARRAACTRAVPTRSTAVDATSAPHLCGGG